MLCVYINEKLPLHTFLPSSTEVLPLPFPVSVVAAMVAMVMGAAAMLRLATPDVSSLLLTVLLIFAVPRV